jgi:hypothetical protein
MMLDHLGARDVAARVTAAVEAAYAAGDVRLRASGQPDCGTAGVTAAVISRL